MQSDCFLHIVSVRDMDSYHAVVDVRGVLGDDVPRLVSKGPPKVHIFLARRFVASRG